jgi:hypothetical protein
MSDSEIEPPPKNEYIDKLTMELLLNKSHYSKYLAKTDPKKHDEFQAHKANLKKHAANIMDITSHLIDAPKSAPSLDIEEAFDAYAKSILRHFELKDLEQPQKEEDEDVLFGQIDNEPTVEPSQSFWGKERVVKKPSGLTADMQAFAKSRRF